MKTERNSKGLSALTDNNDGFSLVELLITVLIIAIVTVPILHSFITSARLTAGSEKYGEATAAAQNICEVIQAKSLTAFLRDQDGSVRQMLSLPVDGLIPVGDGDEVIAIKGLPSGKRTYDARVRFSRGDEDNPASAGIYAINEKELVNYGEPDGVYAQSYLQKNPDTAADDEFVTATGKSLTEVKAKTREINISISGEYDNEELKKVLKRIYLTVSFDYTYTYEKSVTDAFGSPTGETTDAVYTASKGYSIFPNGCPVKQDGRMPSAYIMYFPYYCYLYSFVTGDGSDHKLVPGQKQQQEKITIQNPEDIPLRLFLVKQRKVVQTENGFEPAKKDEIIALDNSYRVEIREYFSSSYDPEIFEADDYHTLYTNAGVRFAYDELLTDEQQLNSPALTYRIFRGKTWYNPVTGRITGGLLDKSAETRLYDVTVDIYASGACDTSGEQPVFNAEPVYTLHTTKVK